MLHLSSILCVVIGVGPRRCAANDGSINGIVSLCITAARAIALVEAGLLFVLLGSYTPILWGTVVVSALASVAALRAREPG